MAVSSIGVMQRLERSVDRRLWAGLLPFRLIFSCQCCEHPPICLHGPPWDSHKTNKIPPLWIHTAISRNLIAVKMHQSLDTERHISTILVTKPPGRPHTSDKYSTTITPPRYAMASPMAINMLNAVLHIWRVQFSVAVGFLWHHVYKAAISSRPILPAELSAGE